MAKIKAQTLKGFRDFLPGVARKRQYVIEKLKKVFESFGFEPLETPALEYEEILLGKYGTEGDKLMYRFTDNGGRKVALRYDQTVPLARVVAEYQNQLPMPFKRYQIQPVWRAENTQKGRFREFMQCDIDTVGTNSPLSDAEIITAVNVCLKALGFKNYKILINDRGVLFGLTVNKVIPQDKVIPVMIALDKLKKIGPENVITEIEKAGFSKEEAKDIIDKTKIAQPTASLQEIINTSKKLGVAEEKIEFYPLLVRGLNYYTGLIFEVEIEGYTAGSVGGGGRFDNLIGMSVGRQIPAVGFAFGFDRLIEAMDQLDLFPKDLITTKVLVTVFSKELESESTKVCSSLRLSNINCELWLDAESKLDKQLKYADQKGIPYVIIIGPDEAKNNTLTLKDLNPPAGGKTQETLSLDEAIQKLT